jgi:hypothetical protein
VTQNPYTPPIDTSDKVSRFAVPGLLLIILGIASLIVSALQFGPSGIALVFMAGAAHWFVLSRLSNPALRPINLRPITIVELLTLVAIACILYGLSIPAVSTQPRRPAPVAKPPVNTPATAP